MENYNNAIVDFIRQYPELESFPYFNTSTETVGNTSIVTSYGSAWEKKYLHGHGVKTYDFSLIYMGRQDSSGTTDNNAVEMFNADKFMAWVDEQNQKKNLPNFANAKVLSIENLQNQPNFAGVNEAGDVAKYMMQVRIRYVI